MRYCALILMSMLATSTVRAEFIFIDEPPEKPIEQTKTSAGAHIGEPSPSGRIERRTGGGATPATAPVRHTAILASTPSTPSRVASTQPAAAVEPPPPPPLALSTAPTAAAAPAPRTTAVVPSPPVTPKPVVDEVALAAVERAPPELSPSTLAVVTAAVVPAAVTHRHTFDVRAGETVRSAFQRWADAAGWTLRWQADFDLRIEADNLYSSDDITEVVPQVLSAFRAPPGQKRLSASAYRGNRVLLIEGKVQ